MARRSTPTLSEAADEYVAYCFRRGGSRGFCNSQTSILRRFARHLRDRQVGTVTPGHVEAFFYGPDGLATSCAHSTMGRYFGILKGFFGWCYRRKWSDDPELLMGGIVHTSTASKRVRLRLSEAQLWAMAENARDLRDRCMLIFAMHTALRISEITSIRLSDLNLEAGEVRIRIHKTKSEDVMKLSETLEREIRAWLTYYSEVSTPGADSYLFPARGQRGRHGREVLTLEKRGFKPDHPLTSPGKHIRNMADRANVSLEDGDGWHTVRRSVARLFFENASHRGHDAALRMTSAFLHHANTATTEIYLGLQHEKAKRDEIMSAGFLSDPFADAGTLSRMNDYRKADRG